MPLVSTLPDFAETTTFTAVNKATKNKVTVYQKKDQQKQYSFLYKPLKYSSSNGQINPNFLGQTGNYVFVLPKGSPEFIDTLNLQLDVTFTAETTLSNGIIHLFQEFMIKDQFDNLLQMFYPDDLLDRILSYYEDYQLDSIFPLIGFDKGMKQKTYYANTSHTFIIPFKTSFVESFVYDYSRAQSELKLNLVSAASQSNMTLNNIFMLCESKYINKIAAFIAVENDFDKHPQVGEFLSCNQVFMPNNVFQAGSNTLSSIPLLTAVKYSHIDIMIRATGSTWTNSTWVSNVYNIGQSTINSIDFLNGSGSSIFGQPISTTFLKQLSEGENCVDNSALARRPVYRLLFCDKISEAYKGEVNGYYYLPDNNHKLVLNLSQAVAEVQTFTGTQFASGNPSYRFYLDGDYSAVLAYNAANTAIATAIQNMPYCVNRGITVTVSTDPSSAASFTVTIINPQGAGLEGKILQMIGGGNAFSSAITTRGQAGLPNLSSQNYDVYLYGYYYQKVYYEP